ncbi:MAG: tetratricopeptide repeat protein, partial [Candidatus Methylomirabilis sp.]
TIPVLLIASLLGAVLVAAVLDGRGALATAEEESLYLPDAKYLKPILIGFHGVAADLLWIRTVQYVGAHLETDRKFPHLAKALDLATSLDPHFLQPYGLGGLFLLYFARQPEAAVSLLEKGAAANPDRWELPHDLGRYYYLEARDYPQALRWWERAAKLPGRPEYLPRFVARLYTKTGHAETALELWLELYRTAPNDSVKSLALREIERLKVAHGSQLTVNGPERLLQ